MVTDFKEVLPEAVIYVYDNNSTDSSVKLAKEAGAVVRHERKQGKGNVIRRMFREIDAEVYIMVDADDTYPAEISREMADNVKNRGADMVVGDRLSSTYFTENKRKFHNFGNSVVRFAINNLFESEIKDIMTGYRAFSYNFVKTYPVISKGFEIETEMTIHAVDRNMQINNIPVDYRDRQIGSQSKLNTYSDGIKVIYTIIKLYKNYKPFAFFSAIAMFLALLSILFFAPVLVTYLETGLVDRFPTLIVCGFVMVMAILLFPIGILLSTLRDKDRCDFEYKLNQTDQMRRMLIGGEDDE